jgi:hypothetical protein
MRIDEIKERKTAQSAARTKPTSDIGEGASKEVGKREVDEKRRPTNRFRVRARREGSREREERKMTRENRSTAL